MVGGQSSGQAIERLGGVVGRSALRVGGTCALNVKTQCFLFTGAWGAPSQPQLKMLVALKKKQANGLRHPSKKEAQGSKSSKPSRRKARFQKSLKNEHHAHTKRKFQKLQTVETGGPLLEETCKLSKQNANFLGRPDNGPITNG